MPNPEQELFRPDATEKREQSDLDAVLQGDWEQKLQTDQYEVALEALGEVKALKGWREATNKSSFSPFYQLFEGITKVNAAVVPQSEKTILTQSLTDRLLPKARSLSPRLRDLYVGLLSEIDGSSSNFTPVFEMTEQKLSSLKESGDLHDLIDPTIPYVVKLNRMQTRLEGELMGRKALDRRDKKAQQEAEELGDEKQEGEQEQENQTPPPDQDESKPSMDEMERLKEGEEAAAIWTITPAYGGYYKEKSFDTWDPVRNVWRQSESQYTTFKPDTAPGKNEIHLKATLAPNQWVRIPTPYTHELKNVLHSDSLIEEDHNGDYRLKIRSVTNQQIDLVFKRRVTDNLLFSPPQEKLRIPSTLSNETETMLQEIKAKHRSKIDQARALASYTMKHLTYSNDSSYNALYENYADGYFAAIDQYKMADCDVANTYFAALCSKLEIPIRHVVGHMVKGKDASGDARITSGTGHAWSEVWDTQKRAWVRIDATPPGDPQQEEDQENDQEGIPGDYNDTAEEAVGPTDEELKQLEEKLSQLTEKLSYTPEERRLAEATGVELREAREIVKEIQEAENTRLPNGEKVVDAMSQLFNLIIESRKTTVPGYTGPLRKREGGEYIDDIVAHKIGVLSGESDPASRQKDHPEEVYEDVIGGFDVYLIGDKSGSMSWEVSGEKKWELQRRAGYLILSSLHRFQQNLTLAKPRMSDPLSVRTEMISFGRGIDQDKPLSPEFSPVDKVTLWHSLGNQGSSNQDVEALSHIYQQIVTEREQVEKNGKKDDKLRIIIACSDGMPDSEAGVHKMARALGELNAVVVGVGLTETAAQVPIIFDTEFSKGDIARDINDLPAIVAKHIVLEAGKLFPEKTKKMYQKQIDALLAKFARV